MEAPKKVKVARARKSSSSQPLAADKPAASSAAASVPASMTITLPADLRIGAAAAVYAELRGVSADQALILDASTITKIDAAGLQSVLAALLNREPASKWSWAAPSEPFLRATRVLGLHDAMALPAK